MSDNAAVVRELFELGLSGGDTAVIDRLVSPEVTFAQPGVPRGREGLGLVVELDNDAFADWRYELDDVLVDGDRVAVRWTARGRHENTYLGEGPTGRDVTQEVIDRVESVGGRWSSSSGLIQISLPAAHPTTRSPQTLDQEPAPVSP